MSALIPRARAYAVNSPHFHASVGSLIEHRLDDRPELRRWCDLLTDEQSRVHEGEINVLESPHFRQAIRQFHAWRLEEVCDRLMRKRAISTLARRNHLVDGMFHSFQFFELQPRQA